MSSKRLTLMFPVVNPRLVESVNRIFPFVYHQFFIIFKLSLSLSLFEESVSTARSKNFATRTRERKKDKEKWMMRGPAAAFDVSTRWEGIGHSMALRKSHDRVATFCCNGQKIKAARGNGIICGHVCTRVPHTVARWITKLLLIHCDNVEFSPPLVISFITKPMYLERVFSFFFLPEKRGAVFSNIWNVEENGSFLEIGKKNSKFREIEYKIA